MASISYWSFGTFRLDPATTCLWQDDQLLPLSPKPFAVLAYLVTNAGEVVTKDDLLDAVWPETAVSEGVLKTCMGQIRKALGETARAPQYIATVHRRGYRFIAPVTVIEQADPSPLSPPSVSRNARHVVGRQAELAQLHQLWSQALQGERQLVFVSGEAGIGKTTLVDALVTQVEALAAVWIGRGQCIEQYGSGEAYLPLLEAFGQLGRGPDGARLVELLRQQAPSWLQQMPALVSDAEYEALQQRNSPVTRDRMLRELAEAVEALTAERPLLLVLEDLHWSDGATLDWLTFIAHRRETARLLIVGTYRPADAVMRAHPVRTVSHELQRQAQATELPLPYLTEADVARYLAQRFGGAQLAAELPRVLHQRTSGNPFFLITIVDELIRRGLLELQAAGWTLKGTLAAVAQEVPESVRQLIDHQRAHISSEAQAVLAVASVVGSEFSAAAVAVCLEQATDEVEAHCDALARSGQFVRAQGIAEWPDGTVSTRYGFIHDLYREVIYDHVPMSRRIRWHAQIGVRLEAGYGKRSQEMVVELATHFVRGRDAARAVHYLRVAGEQAIQRSAHGEAIAHLQQALGLLATLPATPSRLQKELDLQVTLGSALLATKGFAASEVEAVYRRAQVLCGQIEDVSQRFRVLIGLYLNYLVAGALQTAYDLAMQLWQLAQGQNDPVVRQAAHYALGHALFYLGDLSNAHTHLEHGLSLTDTRQSRLTPWPSAHPEVQCPAYDALVLWLLGMPDEARIRMQAALNRARELAHPLTLALTLTLAARLYTCCGANHTVQALVDELAPLCAAQGFAQYEAYSTIWQGWLLAMQGAGTKGMAQLRQGLEAHQSTRAQLMRPYYLFLLAEASGRMGQWETGRAALDTALAIVTQTGERFWEAELHRLRGKLLLAQERSTGTMHEARVEAATRSLQQALAVARQQQAKSLELRAAMSLARLWQSQDKPQDAYGLLAPVYEWFTEGFDTADLQEAKTRLQELV